MVDACKEFGYRHYWTSSLHHHARPSSRHSSSTNVNALDNYAPCVKCEATKTRLWTHLSTQLQLISESGSSSVERRRMETLLGLHVRSAQHRALAVSWTKEAASVSSRDLMLLWRLGALAAAYIESAAASRRCSRCRCRIDRPECQCLNLGQRHWFPRKALWGSSGPARDVPWARLSRASMIRT